jgi:dTDP-4-dehydrorhamnose reductase
MKIVVVGSGGRLGAALSREWRAFGDEIRGFNHASLDLANDVELRRALEAADFDVLVNCAALTNVDYCETHAEEANRINSDAVRTMGAICARKKARCLHFSTDYVFDGEKTTPYTEEDPPRPLGLYAASKLAGERALLEVCPAALVVRVSWVFGPDRPSFVDQILQRARETEDLSAIADKWAAPTFTVDVAHLVRPLLREMPASGLLHLCQAGACTWQEYGQFALDRAAQYGVALKGRTVAPLRMASLKAFVAQRPVYTAMSTAKLTRLTGLAPRSWQDAVDEFVRERAKVIESAPHRSATPNIPRIQGKF